MRILQVITSLRPGGAERLISQVVPLIKNKGYGIDVCLFDGQDSFLKQSLINYGIKVISLGENNNIYNPLLALRLIRIMRDYDIVHTHNTAPQFYAAFASVFAKCKMITTEHNTTNRRRNHKCLKIADRWMYNRYDTIICISNATKNSLNSYLGSLDPKLIVIDNGINVSEFKYATPLDYATKRTRKIVITMVAAFRYQKDQDTLIRAMSRLCKDKFELWLVGDGERRAEIEAMIDTLNFRDNVRLWGIREDIPSIIKSSDIIVQSSHIEGFGLTAVEGMAAGKPVIASDVPGLSQVVSGAGLLFPEGDDKALAECIESISEDRLLYDLVSSNCQKRAEQYDITIMVDKLEQVYRKASRC